jgi:hypothetical protein
VRELLDKVGARIDASVGGDPNLAVQAARLALAWGVKGSPQSRVTETDGAVEPGAARVRAAEGKEVCQTLEQARLDRYAIQVDDADDPTHLGK